MPGTGPTRLGRQRASPRLPVVPLLAAGVSGILVDRWLAPALSIWCAIAWSALIGYVAQARTGRAFLGPSLRTLALLVALACVWGGRHGQTVRYVPADSMERYVTEDAQPVVLRGRLTSDPTDAGCELMTDAVQQGTTWRPARGPIRVRWSGSTRAGANALRPNRLPAYGDQVELAGHLRGMGTPANPGATDWGTRLRGIAPVTTLFVPGVDSARIVDSMPATNVRRWLPRIRQACASRLRRYVGWGQPGLAKAMLLGLRDEVPEDVNTTFRLTGIAHILSISGLHVGMLVSSLLFAVRVRWLPHGALRGVILFCMVYALLTGARAPVVRACVLVQVLCLGWLARRPSSAWNTLACAALILLYARPAELFQLGFQLSFVAVAALAWFTQVTSRSPDQVDPVEQLRAAFRSPWQRWWRSASAALVRTFLASVTVCCVTTPLTMLHFGFISPWAPVANVLLAFPLLVALLSGFVTMACGDWLPWVAHATGWVCGASLSLLCRLGRVIDQLPCSHIWVLGPTVLWVALFYLTWLLAARFAPRLALRCWFVGWIVWFTLALGGGHRGGAQGGPSDLQFHVFAIDHGTCVLLQLPGGTHWLFDAGQRGAGRHSGLEIARALRALRVARIHALFVSHQPSDRSQWLEPLCRRTCIDQVWGPRGMCRALSPRWTQLDGALGDHRVPIRELERDDCLRVGSVAARVLFPVPNPDGQPANDNGLMLLLECGDRRILLAGSLDIDPRDYLIESSPQPVDVGIVPHTRSRRSLERFAAWCQPSTLIVGGARSAGREQRPLDRPTWNLPEMSVRRTDECGCVHGTVHLASPQRGDPVSITGWLDAR